MHTDQHYDSSGRGGTSAAPRVVVRDLRKRYGDIEAASGVSFEVAAGETFGLLGPNGAGKTTTVECVLGLRRPDAGTIEICGIDARRQPREVRQRIGAALQTTAVQDKLTPREALALFGAFYRRRAEPQALLDRFGLLDKADEPCDTLSGGQQQRLALALAFVNTPDVVFLDEPTSGLDPQSRRELHREIARMKHDGHTVLLTTHAMDEAERLCDRIAIIDRGRIVASGTPRDLIARSARLQQVSLIASAPLPDAIAASIPGATQVVTAGTELRFQCEDGTRALAALTSALAAHGLDVVELHVRKASLEDVFLELTAHLPPGADA
jgi:ABC-2 type transport system ATP-binding protein